MPAVLNLATTPTNDTRGILVTENGDVTIPNKYKAITTAKTELVYTGNCILSSILVQGGTAGTITVYDELTATGTPIIAFDSTNALANYIVNAEMTKGLTVVTGSATKLTIFYKTI